MARRITNMLRATYPDEQDVPSLGIVWDVLVQKGGQLDASDPRSMGLAELRGHEEGWPGGAGVVGLRLQAPCASPCAWTSLAADWMVRSNVNAFPPANAHNSVCRFRSCWRGRRALWARHRPHSPRVLGVEILRRRRGRESCPARTTLQMHDSRSHRTHPRSTPRHDALHTWSIPPHPFNRTTRPSCDPLRVEFGTRAGARALPAVGGQTRADCRVWSRGMMRKSSF